MKRAKNSFVLIELVLVILLVSIIAGLSSPVFRNSFASLKLKDACFNIAKLANYAQEMAILERTSYKLNFDSISGKFWLNRLTFSNGEAAVQKIKGDYGKYFLLPRGLSFSAQDKALEIVFYPDGRLKAKELKITANNGEARLINFKTFGGTVEIKTLH